MGYLAGSIFFQSIISKSGEIESMRNTASVIHSLFQLQKDNRNDHKNSAGYLQQAQVLAQKYHGDDGGCNRFQGCRDACMGGIDSFDPFKIKPER